MIELFFNAAARLKYKEIFFWILRLFFVSCIIFSHIFRFSLDIPVHFFSQNIGFSRNLFQEEWTFWQEFKSLMFRHEKIKSAICWSPGLLMMESISQAISFFKYFFSNEKFEKYSWYLCFKKCITKTVLGKLLHNPRRTLFWGLVTVIYYQSSVSDAHSLF